MKKIIITAVLTAALAGNIMADTMQSFTLDNGLKVVCRQNHTSALVNVQLWIHAGSITEKDLTGSGVSHLVEHMLFKGTAKRPEPGRIAREIRRAGGSINAYTSFDHTVVHMTVPSGALELALDITADIGTNCLFDKNELEKEMSVVRKEILMNEDNPDRILGQMFWKTAYRYLPYRHPVIGYSGIFDTLTREKVMGYYQRMYKPNNMLLAVAGDMDLKNLKTAVNRIFGSMEMGSVPDIELKKEPPFASSRTVVDTRDITQAYLAIGWQAPGLFDKNAAIMDVLAVILGTGRSSRLTGRLREELGLVRSITAWCYTPPGTGIFSVNAVLDQTNIKQATKEIMSQVEQLRKNRIKPAELKAAKRKVKADFLFDKETVENQASQIASDTFYTGDMHYSDRYLEAIEKIDVEQLRQAARLYLDPDKTITVTLLPEKQATHPVISGGKTRRQRVKRVKLNNGLTILIGEDHSNPIVSIQAMFKGGVLSESPKTNGLCTLMSRMLIKGTTRHNAEELAESVENRGGHLGTFCGNNSFGVSMDLISEDLKDGLSLLAEILMHPSFKPEEVTRERELLLQQVASRDDRVLNSAITTLRKSFFGSHPYAMPPDGTVESIKSLTTDQIRLLYESLCTSRGMILSIFGDVDPALVIDTSKKLFSSMQSSPQTDCRRGRHIPGHFTETVKTVKREQAVFAIGFPGMNVHDKDRHAMEVLTAAISGQSSIIFNRLREEQGLVYYADATSILGRDPGMYIVFFGTAPGDLVKARTSLMAVLKDIHNNGIDEENMKFAIRNLSGTYSQHHQSNSSRALSYGLAELYGLGFEEEDLSLEKIQAVTMEDINRVIKKIFDFDHCAVVIAAPEKPAE